MNIRFFIVLAAVAGLLLVGVTDTWGQTNAIATGNWGDASTWDNGEPNDATPAAIDGGFTVTIDQSGESANSIDVGSIDGQTGNLDITGGNLFLTGADAGAVVPRSSLSLGRVAGATGNLTMSGGEVFIADDGAAGLGSGDLLVGDNGTGTATFTGGNFTASNEVFVGVQPGSVGTLNIGGTTIFNQGGAGETQNFLLGAGGASDTLPGSDATLNISDSADVNLTGFLFAGFGAGSTTAVMQSGGALEVGADFNVGQAGSATFALSDGLVTINGFLFSSFAVGSSSTITQSGGTINAGGPIVIARQGESTYDHTGGAFSTNVLVVADNFFDGASPSVNGTYNISGDATATVSDIAIVGAFPGANGVVNQTGGIVNAGGVLVGRDGVGTWNICGGELNQVGGAADATLDNLIVGRLNTSTLNQSGGTVSTVSNVFLGDFDNSSGTYNFSGGTLDVAGNFSVGAALASNAPADRVEPDGNNGPQGQALNANGTLIVSGSGGSIDIGGNFLANPSDKSEFRSDPMVEGGDNSAMLVFEILDSTGTTLIDVTGIADLDGSVIDLDLMGAFIPTLNQTFDLLTAASFGSTGEGTTQNVGTGMDFSLASEDASSFSLAVVSGGNGSILQATFLGAAPGGLVGDYNDDGMVDAIDYAVWREALGDDAALLANRDPANSGVVSSADFDSWKSNYGATSAAASGLVGAVPEPGAMLLVLAAIAGGLVSRRR